MPRRHKYLYRIGEPGHYRYFYNQEAYDAYKTAKQYKFKSAERMLKRDSNKLTNEVSKMEAIYKRHNDSKNHPEYQYSEYAKKFYKFSKKYMPNKYNFIKRAKGLDLVKRKAEKLINKVLDVVIPRVRERAEGDEIIREKLPR